MGPCHVAKFTGYTLRCRHHNSIRSFIYPCLTFFFNILDSSSEQKCEFCLGFQFLPRTLISFDVSIGNIF